MEKLQKMISLRHLEVNGERMIGLKFYPDKVIQALVKTLDEPRWHSKHQLALHSQHYSKLYAVIKHL